MPFFYCYPSGWCKTSFTSLVHHSVDDLALPSDTLSPLDTDTSFSATYPKYSDDHSAYLRVSRIGNPDAGCFGIFVVLQDDFLAAEMERGLREVRIKFKITFGEVAPWHVSCHLVPLSPSRLPPLDFLIYLTVTSPILSGLEISSSRTLFHSWRGREAFKAPITSFNPSLGSGAVRVGRMFLFEPSPMDFKDLQVGEVWMHEDTKGTEKYGIFKHLKYLVGGAMNKSIELFFFPYISQGASGVVKWWYERWTKKGRRMLGFESRWKEGRELVIESEEGGIFEEDFGEEARIEVRIGKKDRVDRLVELS